MSFRLFCSSCFSLLVFSLSSFSFPLQSLSGFISVVVVIILLLFFIFYFLFLLML